VRHRPRGNTNGAAKYAATREIVWECGSLFILRNEGLPLFARRGLPRRLLNSPRVHPGKRAGHSAKNVPRMKRSRRDRHHLSNHSENARSADAIAASPPHSWKLTPPS
jgi:hypothetical protein